MATRLILSQKTELEAAMESAVSTANEYTDMVAEELRGGIAAALAADNVAYATTNGLSVSGGYGYL